MTTNNNFLEQCKADYCQNFVRLHSGEEGFLKTEDGIKLPCKFEAGQFEDGEIILTCDFSVFDFQKCFSIFHDLEKSSVSEIKQNMAVFSWPVYSFFEKFRNFNGISSDRLMRLTGTINFLSKIDNNSIDAYNSELVTIAYSISELTAKTNTNENLQYAVFGITNFKFGNKSDEVLSLDIKGVKGLTIKKNENYEDTLNFLKCSKGIRVTCNVKVEIDNKTKIKELEGIICDLCDLLSIACGTRIQWIYYFACNFEEEIVLWNHSNKVTKPCHFSEIIGYMDLKKFLESSYVALAEKSNLLRYNEGTAKPLINAYLDAKAENDYLEGRGIKLVVVIEMLKELVIKLRLTTKNIIKEEYFEGDLKPKIEEVLSNAIEQSIYSKYGKKSEQDLERIIKETKEDLLSNISSLNETNPTFINKKYFKEAKLAIEKPLTETIRKSVNQECREISEQDIEEKIKKLKEEILNQISGLNYVSFKQILRTLCDYINLKIDDSDLQSVVYSRNSLIHEGNYFCDSDRIKDKYKNKKRPSQFQDSEHEYFFLMNFVDQCFLKLLHYKGYYYKWKSVHEIKRVELK